MILRGHHTCRKVWVKARTPAAHPQAPAGLTREMASAMELDEASGEAKFRRTPYLERPNVGFRVPAKPLRFEFWGAHEDLSLPLAHALTAISKLSSPNPKNKGQEFILVRATDVV